jgi:uncharacterized protein YbaP (TraB family)
MGRTSIRLALFFFVAVAIHVGLFLGVFALLPAERTFMWKVASGEGTVYVLGSIHVADRSIYPLDPRIYAAFGESSKLVLEVDVEGDADEVLRAVGQRGIYRDGRSLESELPPALLDKLKKALFKRGIPFDTVRGQRPWLVLMTLATLELSDIGLDAEHGVEQHFLARNRGEREVESLETADFQVELLSGLPEDLQLLALEQLLEDDSYREHLGEIIAAWKAGDADGLEDLLFAEADKYREVFQALFYDRNAAMAEKIAGFLAGDQVHFVVVGAGHLVGDQSVIALLERDFEVEQI